MTDRHFVIWDIDGVMYDYHRLQDQAFYKLCDEANAKAALELLPHLNQAEALRLAAECFEQFHDCYGAFMPLVAESGLGEDKFRMQLFKRYHALLLEMIDERHPDFFDDQGRMFRAFSNAGPRVGHGALSHSCMEGWGLRILDKLGILPFFEPKALLGLDQYGFARKFESAEPVKIILENMRADPARSFFVEDSVRNLEPAAEIKGLRLIYIHNGKPLDKPPAFVAGQFASPVEFMSFVQSQLTPASI